MTADVRHFLITFDRSTSTLLHCDEFEDGCEALQAYDKQEALAGSEIEVVLLAADSIDTIRVTHGRYFAEPGTAAFRALSTI